jgi:hypothetical protein
MNVINPVPNVMNTLTSPGQELADRGIRTERLKKLNVARARAKHRLAHALRLVHLHTDNIEAE